MTPLHAISCRTAQARSAAGEQLVINGAPCFCGGSTLRPAEAEISLGTRPGFVQIVFPEKPAASDLAALKAARFRFTSRDYRPLWYGLAAKAPTAYAPAVAALMTFQDAS